MKTSFLEHSEVRETNSAMTATRADSINDYDLGPIERIPVGEGRLFFADTTLVAIFRSRSGKVFATQPECPHRGGPLADGIVGEKTLICPLHGNKFDLETGEPIGNECASLKTYRVEISTNGHIVIAANDLSVKH